MQNEGFMPINSEEQRRADRRFRVWAIVLSVLSVVLILFAVLNTVVYDRVEVDGTSMLNTLLDKDVLRYEKLNKNPSREDIVILTGIIGTDSQGNDRWIIKRVIGLPGDTVEIKDGKVYRTRQGAETEELSNYGHDYTYPGSGGQTVWNVGENQIFYLGDNRDPGGSSDARMFGMCTYDNVVGVVPSWAVSIKGITTFFHRNIILPIQRLFSCSGE